ncbi:flagellar motor protein MotB [Massilia scottii]|uniref:flagellar motor protein MotB n=1 Tax=Massilia scottii TaxID=3057166 RepID=UPI002796B758|nr:flagellar motor protein MotB [Massilia sp. CCM 9029]MDQ1832908.1 flagellar motor protein MotB [Massilia sp. CCM 9029]
MQKQHDKHDKHDAAIIVRGRGKAHEDDHGGAWKVAFADFCLALLALFLVLWLMAARDQQTMKAMVREQNGSYADGQGNKPEIGGGPRGSLIERFSMPHSGTSSHKENGGEGPKVRYDSPAELAVLSRQLGTMSVEAGLSNNLETVITPYGLRVTLHDTDRQGMFLLGSAMPTDRFGRLMRQMGPVFAKMENQMLIVGHTDSRKYAGDQDGNSNWTLSNARAMAARSQLLAGSMNPDSVLQVVGMADRAPFEPSNTGAAVNRRIELLILTNSQASTVAAMFGVPGKNEVGAETAVGTRGTVEELRNKLKSVRNANGADAQGK